MVEPSRSTSRRVIAGAALAVLAVAGAGFALGRSTADPEAAPAAPAQPPTPAPALPAEPPVLGRADLLAAARTAVDAYGAGRPLPPGLANLAGRAFELRLPFGCAPRPGDGSRLSWTYDETEQALRIRVEPAELSPTEWLEQAAAEAETIEGFWIERPWTSSETCPAAPPELGPVAAAVGSETAAPGVETGSEPAPTARTAPLSVEPTLGIAQIFAPGSSRISRREGRPFQAVEAIAPEALNLSQGLRLRLRGEVTPSPAGTSILCRGPADRPPRCLIVVRLNEVAIENPATGVTIASWDVASPEPAAE